jgi:hypothetical protein
MTLVDTYSAASGLFEFDIATPLFEQMCSDLELLEPLSLNDAHLQSVKRKPGLYTLCLNGNVVYVGKADVSALVRLRKHFRQLTGRHFISPTEVSFKCLHFAKTWDPFKPEDYLVRRLCPEWNDKGFGPNDPGRRRDMTNLGDDHWHVRYPINTDYFCANIPYGQYDILELLRLICREAPFWVRFQGNRHPQRRDGIRGVNEYEEAHSDFNNSRPICLTTPGGSVKDLMIAAVNALPNPSEWQLTELPSHLLLYKEQAVISYPRMRKLWPND